MGHPRIRCKLIRPAYLRSETKIKGSIKLVEIEECIKLSITGTKTETYATSETKTISNTHTITVDGEKNKFGIYAGLVYAYKAKATKFKVSALSFTQHYVVEKDSCNNVTGGYYEDPVLDSKNSFTETYVMYSAIKDGLGLNAYYFNCFEYFENIDEYMERMYKYELIA